MRHSILLGFWLGLASVWSPRTSAAQAHTVVVRVRVIDSAGTPIQNADASVVRGLNDVVARGTTDANGQRQLSLTNAEGDYQVVVRRVGYTRSDLFFTVAARDTLPLDVTMARAVGMLDTVRVNGESAIRRREYHIDADQIASSNRPVADGWDVVERLRPEMLLSLVGARDYTNREHFSGQAPPLQSVFVNGERVSGVAWDDMFMARLQTTRTFTTILRPMRGGRRTVEAAAILASIHSEHIAEMRYVPPSENTADVNEGGNAVFVVLKPGVSFEPGRGSFISGDSLPRNIFAVYPTAGFERYRYRLMGVYDEASGAPIANVKVVDTSRGDWVMTSSTGTVSLFFVPDGGSQLRVEGAGYDSKTLAVSISPSDTLPVVVTLRKAKPGGH